MAEDVDIPTETLQEKIEEVKKELHEAEHKAATAGWITYLAVTTAIMAVLAAISALLSGQAADEALLQANNATYHEAVAVDAWAEFQADSIKAVEETNAAALLSQLKAAPSDVAAHRAEAARRKANQQKDQAAAEAAQVERDAARAESDGQAQHRQRFAFAVTLFQVGIGLSAVGALVRRRELWLLSLAGAVAGVILLGAGFAPIETGHAAGPTSTPVSTVAPPRPAP